MYGSSSSHLSMRRAAPASGVNSQSIVRSRPSPRGLCPVARAYSSSAVHLRSMADAHVSSARLEMSLYRASLSRRCSGVLPPAGLADRARATRSFRALSSSAAMSSHSSHRRRFSRTRLAYASRHMDSSRAARASASALIAASLARKPSSRESRRRRGPGSSSGPTRRRGVPSPAASRPWAWRGDRSSRSRARTYARRRSTSARRRFDAARRLGFGLSRRDIRLGSRRRLDRRGTSSSSPRRRRRRKTSRRRGVAVRSAMRRARRPRGTPALPWCPELRSQAV